MIYYYILPKAIPLILFFLVAAGEPHANSRAEVTYAIVRVNDKSEQGVFCTGFAYRDHYLATAAHCAVAARQTITAGGLVFLIREGTKIPFARILDASISPEYKGETDIEGDVALLRIKNRFPVLASLGNPYSIRQEDKIYTYGYAGCCTDPYQPIASLTEGIVSRLMNYRARNMEPRYVIQHTAYIAKGMSGSPLFNDKNEVIGVNVGSFMEHVQTDNGKGRQTLSMSSPGLHIAMRIDLLRTIKQ